MVYIVVYVVIWCNFAHSRCIQVSISLQHPSDYLCWCLYSYSFFMLYSLFLLHRTQAFILHVWQRCSAHTTTEGICVSDHSTSFMAATNAPAKI